MDFSGIFKYYKNNIKRFISITAGIALSVVLVYVFQMVVDSINKSAYSTTVEPRKFFSIVRQKDLNPDEVLINRIKAQPFVDRVLPFVYWTTNMQMTIGGVANADILQVTQKDMKLLMNKMGLKIVRGRLPVPEKHEILMHERVAENKHLEIGDLIGSWVSKDEFVHGSYKVVGLIEGRPIVSFAPIETAIIDYNMNYEYIFGGIILPKKGQLKALNDYLETIPNSYQVITYDSSLRSIRTLEKSISLLTTGVSFMIMIIVSLFTGLLCYIYFYQRRNEFGLLWALGFTRQQVVNRTILEIGGMNAAGFLLGFILSISIGQILNTFVYMPRGEELYLLSADCLLKALSIPIFSTLFSIVPIWRMLKSLDPIAIIEGVV